MLHKHVFCVFLEEFPDVSWIPQLAGHTQVFTAAHQRVRLAAFGGGGNGFRAEVSLLATGDGHKSNDVNHQLAVTPHNQIISFADLPSATNAYSLVTAVAVMIVSPLGANPQAPGPNALFNILLYLISGR